MKTIVYFEADGEAALLRVAQLRALNGEDTAQAIQVDGYVGERIKADKIEFMPCVQAWKGKKIETAFAEQQERERIAAEQEAERRKGLPPLKSVDEESFRRSMSSKVGASAPSVADAITSKVDGVVASLTHTVTPEGEKYVVKAGDKIVAGPFDQEADAMAFADQQNAP